MNYAIGPLVTGMHGMEACPLLGRAVDMAHTREERDSGQRDALAAAIDRRRGDVEARWLGWVKDEIARKPVDPTELRDAIELYLARIAELLRGGGSLEQRGSEAWQDVTREHAANRVRLGFDVQQLVHEFVLLRRALVQIAHEEGIASTDQIERLSDLIDGAVGMTVKHYVESRDYAARRAEAQHIAFLTHELRNPLNTAMMAATQLRRSTSTGPLYRRVVDLLESSHRRLQRLIEEVLLAERLEAGAVEPHPSHTPLRLGDILEETLIPALEAAQAKGLELKVDLDPELLLRVDPQLTSSAVQNLVDNAVKFTDEGAVKISVDDQPTSIVLHVRDQCGGIGEEDLQSLFEPFRRARPDKPGSGLGLAIARRAVEAQGGSIHVESSRKGCHFWLTLPKSPP